MRKQVINFLGKLVTYSSFCLRLCVPPNSSMKNSPISELVSKELRKGYIEACRHYHLEYLSFPPGELNRDMLKEGHPTAKGHRAVYEAVRTMFAEKPSD